MRIPDIDTPTVRGCHCPTPELCDAHEFTGTIKEIKE